MYMSSLRGDMSGKLRVSQVPAGKSGRMVSRRLIDAAQAVGLTPEQTDKLIDQVGNRNLSYQDILEKARQIK